MKVHTYATGRRSAYSKFHLDCPVRFAPYILAVKISKDRPKQLLLWETRTLHLAGKPQKPRLDMKNRDIWSHVSYVPSHRRPNPNRTIQMKFTVIFKPVRIMPTRDQAPKRFFHGRFACTCSGIHTSYTRAQAPTHKLQAHTYPRTRIRAHQVQTNEIHHALLFTMPQTSLSEIYLNRRCWIRCSRTPTPSTARSSPLSSRG